MALSCTVSETRQTTGQLTRAKRPSTWPVVGLTTGQSALAAGVLTTRSTPNSIDNNIANIVREEHICNRAFTHVVLSLTDCKYSLNPLSQT